MDDEATGSYEIGTVPGGVDVELARLRAQATQAWDQEAAVLSSLGLRDGMAILEPGAGPGFVTEQLLAMLPASTVTVVERDPEMLEFARKHLGDAADRVRFVPDSVLDTGLPDGSFDFVYARLLFQHLPDPVSAARELRRLLRPGGRLVIMDVDDALHLRDPDYPPEVDAVERRLSDDQAARGGNRHIGRRLPAVLRAAGLADLTFATVMQHSDVRGMDSVLPREAPEMYDELVSTGMVSPDERDALLADDAAFRADADSIMILTAVIASGRRS